MIQVFALAVALASIGAKLVRYVASMTTKGRRRTGHRDLFEPIFRDAQRLCAQRGLDPVIEVDGGENEPTARQAAGARDIACLAAPAPAFARIAAMAAF